MEALGEHVLIRKPKKTDAKGAILLPDDFDNKFAYGEVLSVGPEASKLLGNRLRKKVHDGMEMWDEEGLKEGQIVVFDHLGARDLELDGKKDARLVCCHASMLFNTITEQELKARDLPLP